jgi:multiple sugar transport system substrate-binding protein
MLAERQEEDAMSDPTRHTPEQVEVGERLLTRRGLLSGGAAGLAAVYGVTAGTGTAARLPRWMMSRSASGTVTFGSNYSDPVPKAALKAALDRFTKISGISVKINTVDHNTFQEQINNYLQGRPDDVFAWFAGYRMQFFAQKGLATPIDDVWKSLAPQMSPALKAQSTGLDGHQYFVPLYYYAWGVFYRKSLFKQHGYTVPRTWDQYLALVKKMKADGITPIAMGDKDGWPAMGTFDYINMRINGYAFHIRLMKGKESWDSPQVKNVFNHWRELIPYYQPGATGRIWQDAVQSLAKKQTGLAVHGTGQVGPQFQQNGAAVYNDLDFFAFPQINARWGQDSIEAPIDGFMLSRKPQNEDGAKALLKYLGGPIAQNTYLKSDPNNIATNKRANTAGYNHLQKKSLVLIAKAKHISQFLDRDTRPDFASTVMIPALQQFLNNPNDVNGLVKSIERQKKAIFGS